MTPKKPSVADFLMTLPAFQQWAAHEKRIATFNSKSRTPARHRATAKKRAKTPRTPDKG